MKNKDHDPIKDYGSLALSVIIHGLLLFYIATITLDAVAPLGNVEVGTVEFSVAPKGAQLETTNVQSIVQEDIPEMVKAKATPPPPPPPEPTTQEKYDDIFPVEDSGDLPVEAKAEPEEKTEPQSTTTTTLVVAAALPTEMPKKIENTSATDTAPPIAAPVENSISGNDEANLAAQEKSVNQNYGIAEGVQSITTLTAIPGNKVPEYPIMYRLKEIEGEVRLQATVSESGTLSNLRVLSAQTFKAGQPANADAQPFVDNSVKAVKTWRYKGTGRTGEYEIPLRFSLKGSAKELPAQLRRKSN